MDQQVYLIIILLLATLIAVLALIVALLVFKIFKTGGATQQEEPLPERKTEAKTGQVLDSDPHLQVCINHPERQAQGICAISQDPICEGCIREDDGLVISVDHFRTYLQSVWVSIESVKATPDDTLASAHIYQLKIDLWQTNKTPTFVSTHYKIDVDTDQIESHIQFFVREEEKEELKREIEKSRPL